MHVKLPGVLWILNALFYFCCFLQDVMGLYRECCETWVGTEMNMEHLSGKV